MTKTNNKQDKEDKTTNKGKATVTKKTTGATCKEEKVVVRQKPRNFTPEEDVFLTRAYVSCSLDPINGADQKGTTFWANVYTTFKALMDEEAEVQVLEERNYQSLQNRWKRQIQHDAAEWVALLKSTPMQSGKTKPEHYKHISELYWEKFGRPYRFDACNEYLLKLPKFDPNLKEQEEGDAGSEDGKSVYSNHGTNMERPIGRNKAKDLLKGEKLKEKLMKERLEAFKSVSSSVGKLAEAIELSKKRDYLMSMFQLFRESGDQALAQDYFQQFRDLEKKKEEGAAGEKASEKPDDAAVSDLSDGGSPPKT